MCPDLGAEANRGPVGIGLGPLVGDRPQCHVAADRAGSDDAGEGETAAVVDEIGGDPPDGEHVRDASDRERRIVSIEGGAEPGGQLDGGVDEGSYFVDGGVGDDDGVVDDGPGAFELVG